MILLMISLNSASQARSMFGYGSSFQYNQMNQIIQNMNQLERMNQNIIRMNQTNQMLELNHLERMNSNLIQRNQINQHLDDIKQMNQILNMEIKLQKKYNNSKPANKKTNK